ncbi:thioredoxin family protein [Shewanella ulleungensis]|jgi:small redox-active disulfide protein 2|uniref:Redox-active disulfide protein 2 n=1 Tax=Shewanella ulleungensis TaxID=2282699 RepID=A0ABQ2QLE9_9GAMM|nr:thioredoxin family protein [Shewanella ulleungensis]MCL1150186.1 thioredoxin family protein [Shewanella ulleungensis]GGP87106.1 redox-active disulfide protein 2 [Shewanella ulleungensis]
MEIKILGTGCTKCQKLTDATIEAAKTLNIDFNVSKVTDIEKIMDYDVMSTPALVVDDKVLLSGRLATIDEITTLLQAHV